VTFRVYPKAPEPPLRVDPDTTSPPIEIDELVAENQMFIRFVVLGAANCEPPPAIHPAVILVSDGSDHEVTSVDGVQPTVVAAGVAATVHRPGPGGRGVYLLELFKTTQQPIQWQIRFHNNDSAARRFTWVVADQKTQTLRPWIDLPATAGLEFNPGESVTKAIPIANLGTGRLEINDPQGFSPGPGFVLADVPARVSPNACEELQVRFSAVDPAAPLEAVYLATSNDITAQTTPGHNRRVSLTATQKGLPPGTIITIERNMADAIELFQIHPGTGVRDRLKFTAGLLRSRAVTVARDGSLLVAGRRPFEDVGAIVRVNPTTGHQADVASAGMLVKPAGLVEDGDTILVVEEDGLDGNGGVIKVNPATGDQTQLAVGGSVFKKPVAIAIGAGGTILLLARNLGGEWELYRIHRQTGEPTALSDPVRAEAFGLAVDADGMVLVCQHTSTGGSVVRIKPVPGGQKSTVTFSNSLHAVGLAVEHDGRILVADDGRAGTGGVKRVGPTGGDPVTLSASTNPFRGPHAIAVVPGRT
jgi:DNA-binding beta-propeller fold protein YncE